jgi:acetylornithine deacetylase|tara:strand:+ start:2096 stop:3229 length:1134 start_codon:yes stop_codon:yes gene_type:complete
MIERLIAFDTTSRNSNLDLIHHIRDYLADLGIESQLVHNDDGSKANLYCTIGPKDVAGVALSGHTDVVPIDAQDWRRDPWKVSEADGKLFGRGSCDMKSFIAVCLAFAPKFQAANLKMPVHFCFSFDEEVGCKGVRPLLEFLSRQAVQPRLAIIGEPTLMQVITGHKGKLTQTCHVQGFECHSSLAPQGVNAVQYAAKLVDKLTEMADRKAAQGPFDPNYDVPHTTIHTGVISGGTAVNIVPKDCQFTFEFRLLPQDDGALLFQEVKDYAARELLPAMQAVRPETSITFEEYSSFPPLDTPIDHEVVALAKALSGANATSKVAFGTEAGLFSHAGIPAVICGPGSIEQAHKPDEYITLEQVALCEAFMERLRRHLSH